MSILGFDTTVAYRKVFDSLFQKQRNEEIIEIKSKWLFSLESIIEVCGYVKDKRFIAPLEDIYKGDFDEKTKKETEKALVRMQVEPYFTDYLKNRTRSLKDIEQKKTDFDIWDFSTVLHSQESYKELSKYLLCDLVYWENYDGNPDLDIFYYQQTLSILKNWIENEELQDLISALGSIYSPIPKERRQKIYDWMQKNYGKYEIRRIW